jgi:hypothetical protein
MRATIQVDIRTDRVLCNLNTHTEEDQEKLKHVLPKLREVIEEALKSDTLDPIATEPGL